MEHAIGDAASTGGNGMNFRIRGVLVPFHRISGLDRNSVRVKVKPVTSHTNVDSSGFGSSTKG